MHGCIRIQVPFWREISSKAEELQKPGRQSAEVSATLTESEVEVKIGGSNIRCLETT